MLSRAKMLSSTLLLLLCNSMLLFIGCGKELRLRQFATSAIAESQQCYEVIPRKERMAPGRQVIISFICAEYIYQRR
jgi:hypothetical protein